MSLFSFIKKTVTYNPTTQSTFELGEDLEEDSSSTVVKQKYQRKSNRKSHLEKSTPDDEAAGYQISSSLEENKNIIKKVYSLPQNSDIVLREISIPNGESNGKVQYIKAFAIFIDGMVDRQVINDFILKPLMLINCDYKKQVTIDSLLDNYLPESQMKIVNTFEEITEAINFGNCIVFIDGDNRALSSDVKGFEHRGIERPTNESIIMGPQESFTESLRTNTAMVRRRILDEDLVMESTKIGKRGKTPLVFVYIKNIANDKLVNEVKRRVKSINVDFINDTGELEQFIEDETFNPVPQVLRTERPDLVASKIMEGKVAIIMNGSPYAIIAPTSISEMVHTSEDMYLRYPYVGLMKIIRILCLFIALLLPGLYVAITSYHQEMIPATLLYAIEAAKEKVPFTVMTEILIMEFVFDLISEAAIRVPKPVGATFGIVGALVLGQAAVDANIVSPILIIIVAITGLASFTIPNYSFTIALRVMKYLFIFIAAIAGMLGITVLLFLCMITLSKTQSFGISMMTPFTPQTAHGTRDAIVRRPVWKMRTRPDYLNPKDNVKQPKYSRGWWKEDNDE